MAPLPPLLADRPPALRLALTYVTPAIGGFATGASLGIGLGIWIVANVLATIGGFGAGFEHVDLKEAARRGATGGLVFGLALVLADATVVSDRVATIADPAIAQAVITTTAGTLLALAGATLRARLERRSAAPAV
jgi:lactate dehydrogenase-like 2-hydroxyacid dehydrogenase